MIIPHRARHALHHLTGEPTVMALAYGAATPLAHSPVGLALITVGYLTVVAVGATGEHHAERVQRDEPCVGRHAVCRFTP